MIPCPYCDAKNIEGVDVCEQCGQPLSDLHLSDPKSLVEWSLLRDRVELLATHPAVVATPSTSVREVLSLLVEKSIGCVVIVDNDNKVTGVFSERDALQRLNTASGDLLDHPIAEYMTSNPQTLEATSKVAFAVQKMDVGGYRHIPIVDGGGRITRIVSVRDILRYLTEKMTNGAIS